MSKQDTTARNRKSTGGDGSGASPGSAVSRVPGLDKNKLRRTLQTRKDGENAKVPKTPASVSAGPIEKVIELAFNPSRDKLREVTIIDRMQGRTFPLIDTMGALFMDCVKIAAYRQAPEEYEAVFEEEHPPVVFDIMGEYLVRTAQWQKSIAGKNLERATDIALAETEKGPEDEDQYPTSRGYED
jgi:hypothetical protein